MISSLLHKNAKYVGIYIKDDQAKKTTNGEVPAERPMNAAGRPLVYDNAKVCFGFFDPYIFFEQWLMCTVEDDLFSPTGGK
jgi:hypothetical protein